MTNAAPLAPTRAPDFSGLTPRQIEDDARTRLRELYAEEEEVSRAIVAAIRRGAGEDELRGLRARRREIRDWTEDLGRLSADLLTEAER